ncbi:hypothetical protein At1D1609_25140 [Agrobacterium tumefaciens]|uniref:Uncharacterized protein n=1 Tax=Agrobacterium tumefaciens TaxID=358 RepID=A0A2L2LEA9_AGRTU|nr:hypothetical protein At1D1609_25140 [Agrobacterium tumefaciens]
MFENEAAKKHLADLPLEGEMPGRAEGGNSCSVSNEKTAPNNGGGTHLANQLPLPPHFPLATLKLPQDIGFLQSEIRSLLSGR